MHRISETIERKFIDSIELDDEWEIESDEGWVPVTHIHKTVEYEEWVIKTESSELICADTHILFDENKNEIFAKDLIPNKSLVFTKDGPNLVKSVTKTDKHSNMFDITVNSNNHRFYSGEFLSHNTITSVSYILWLSLFNSDQNIAILANKGDLAREILDRYQLAYENLPKWLQQGVRVWNKGNIELENGSKVLASATSSNAIRGGSFSCVFLDEFAFVPPNIAENFFTSVYPVISSGKNTKMIIVSTPNGMNLFYKMWTDAIGKRSDYKPFSIHWSMVPGRDEKFKEETIKNTSLRQWQQEFECEFIGSSNTLISGEKLACLTYKENVTEFSGMKVYEEPVKESFNDNGEQLTGTHLYAICVDISEGRNLDYSAFSVFDVSTMPYKQVATYRSNTISPLLYPNIIKMCAEYYNEAYVLIEINNNPQVAEFLHEDLEYDNILKVSSGNKKAQTISSGFSKGSSLGLKMSPLVKRVGCSTLKTLIEMDKLIINDFETYSELTTFVSNSASYQAEEGCNDDFAMTLVIFAWLSTQKYFKEIVDHDIRKQLQIEQFSETLEESEELLPIGELNNGLETPYFIEGDTLWTMESGKDPYDSIMRELLDF